MKRVRLLGIAGGSCTGKTTLARGLARELDAVVFSLDAYYHDASGVPDEALDVDTPEALDHELIVGHLTELAAGRTIEQPVYEFRTHARCSGTTRVEPADWVIVEGLYALYWGDVRRLLDVRLFVEVPEVVSLERRIERDARQRGREERVTRNVVGSRVNPRRVQYVDPTRRFAHRVLDGTRSIAEQIDFALAELRRRQIPGV